MMKRLLTVVVAFLAACSPDIPNSPPPAFVIARFDPSLSPPLVPSPNDLATAPTGLLNVPIPATATEADKAFYAWLNTLSGFPASASALTTFSSALDPASVTGAIKVIDLTANNAAVTTATVKYTDGADGAPSTVTISPPPTGWSNGHAYAIAVASGVNGVKGADGQDVVSAPTWALLKAMHPVAVCPDNDFSDPSACRLGTELIPSDIKGNPAERLADQLSKATRLEQLRLKYKPVIEMFETMGIARADLALMWTFKIDSSVVFNFNPTASPPVVPSPNDLAIVNGKVNAPVNPAWSDAYKEFTTDYINTLNGFPSTATATATVGNGDLDLATVNDTTVKVIVVQGEPLTGTPTIEYKAAAHALVIAPPLGGWGKRRTIAIAVVGGANGVKSVASNEFPMGRHLVATPPMALALSEASLVDCETLGPSCNSVVPAAPITSLQAAGLERLRRGYKPVVDVLVAGGLERKDIAGLWVFSTVSQPELTFDLSSATPVIPFPANQFLRQTDDVDMTKHLIFPPSTDPVRGPLFQGLNSLNGFSLTAPIVSENSDALTALDQGNIDAGTLGSSTGFAKLASAFPDGGVLNPDVTACLNCVGSTGAGPQPEQLQWVPRTPLQENTRYAAWATTEMTDTEGRNVIAAPTFALVRLKASLLDAEQHSTVPVLADAQAQALEPYRLRFKDCLDQVEARGVPRKNIALGFCMTTQSTATVVKQLAGAVMTMPPNAAISFTPTMLANVTTTIGPRLDALGIPHDKVGAIVAGILVLPFGLNTPTKTLNPDPTTWTVQKAPFYLALPATAAPSGGYPVVIFGHGLTRTRQDMAVIANTFAGAGFATLAIDAVYHGDRSTCVGTPIPNPDFGCADSTTQKCDLNSGRCVARDQDSATPCDFAGNGDLTCFAASLGLCQSSGKCEGGDFLRRNTGEPLLNAHNFLDLKNFFITRDHFRYTGAVDFTSLVRMIQSNSNAPKSLNLQLQDLSLSPLDGSNIHYTGQSLGSFNGVAFAAANPAARHVALNVPGSDQVQVLLTAPSFSSVRNSFLSTLAAAGLNQGEPGFDAFMVLAKTIIDPADPQNLVYDAVNSSNTERKIYIQYIQGDETLPNPTTELLINAAQRNTQRQAQIFEFVEGTGPGFIPASYATGSRHSFLLSPSGNSDCNSATASCATAVGQFKVASFLNAGIAP